MAQPYVGEIRMFGGNFAPEGWKFCDGSQVSIIEYEALFQLIGTSYGGNGQSDFALPDLRGRVPIHHGNGAALAEKGGVESVTLTIAQMAAHNHQAGSNDGDGNSSNPFGSVPATNMTAPAYSRNAPQQNMKAESISNTGGNQPHDNMQPYLCVSFIIATYGIFPSQT